MSFKQNLKSLVWGDYISALIMDPRLLLLRFQSQNAGYSFVFSGFVSCSVFSYFVFSMLLSQSEFFYYKITYGLFGYVILMTDFPICAFG